MKHLRQNVIYKRQITQKYLLTKWQLTLLGTEIVKFVFSLIMYLVPLLGLYCHFFWFYLRLVGSIWWLGATYMYMQYLEIATYNKVKALWLIWIKLTYNEILLFLLDLICHYFFIWPDQIEPVNVMSNTSTICYWYQTPRQFHVSTEWVHERVLWARLWCP